MTWQSALDGRYMDNDTGALRNHRRQQGAIETDSGHQVPVQLFRPLRVIECREAASRCAGAAKDIDEDVNTTELLQHRVGN